MSFLAELCVGYVAAYRIVVRRYPSLAWHFFLASLLMVAMATLSAMVPYMMRETINALSIAARPDLSGNTAILLAVGYGACWTGARIFEWLRAVISSIMLARCDASFQYAFYSHLIRVEYPRLIEIDPGAMLAVVTRARVAFGMISTTVFWVIAPTLFQLTLAGGVLWHIKGALFSVGFVVSVFILFVVTWCLSTQSRRAHAALFSASNTLSSHFIERLNFIVDIKINDACAREEVAFGEYLKKYIGQVFRANLQLSILLAIQAVCAGALLTAFTAFSADNVHRSALGIGDFVMIVGYLTSLTAPFVSLAASLSDVRRNQLALREGFDVLEMPLESGIRKSGGEGAYPFAYLIEGVSLSIGGRSIFENIFLRVEKGKFTVLIGPSGHGKSTLIYLMLGLIRPLNGAIFLNGVDISSASVAAITEQVAVVPQTPLILTGTLRDNLIFGCLEPPSDAFLVQIINDLELFGLGEIEVPNVLDRMLGVQGRELSGGERQRVAVGRALARQTAILILDEPTSSLDIAQELRILERIRRYAPTIFVVTHRLALLKYADRVYQIDSGHIREETSRGLGSDDVFP
ncbi:ATP-binding cassette domain-containing protein [Pandoraea sp. NPDC087047]|uniref:ATP-binding cassette domain-containing protein n=1 Tax=Pandoraea sp. NPDC087047 TaxID=3364390 RepID=UPI00381559EF